ncbi:MAG: hypothetical protein SCK70_14620 [bacterium]|nr:hypothetical protein [bacterium]
MNGFFSKIIEKRVEEDGWIFCQTDSIYFAVKTLTHGKWIEQNDHYRLTLNNPKTGVIMEVAQQAEFPSFDEFKTRIKSNPLSIDRKKLHVSYTNSRGNNLEFTYPDQRFVDGQRINFDDWQLFDGPFIFSEKGSKIFEIRYRDEKVVLDFNRFEVKFEGMNNKRNQ